MAKAQGRTIMPHSPYFGPGYWATLQLAAAYENAELFEYLYIKPEADVGLALPHPKRGQVAVPAGPGLGFQPDMAVIDRFRIQGLKQLPACCNCATIVVQSRFNLDQRLFRMRPSRKRSRMRLKFKQGWGDNH